METVNLDLKKYLQRNIFPSRTVLVFPPFNGFRRFLIHKLIEDNFASSEVAAFSIGQDINRRIVICYKGLIREDQKKGTASNLSKKTGNNMIEKERQSRQKLTPTAAVYRPPAARVVESRSNSDSVKAPESKRNRVRRPDQQMYVPRPKRASYSNEQPRSRSHSSSRTSLDNDTCEKRTKISPNKNEESRLSGSNYFSCEKDTTELPLNLPCSIEMCSRDNLSGYSPDTSSKMVDIIENNCKVQRLGENVIRSDLREAPSTSSQGTLSCTEEELRTEALPKAEGVLRTEALPKAEGVLRIEMLPSAENELRIGGAIHSGEEEMRIMELPGAEEELRIGGAIHSGEEEMRIMELPGAEEELRIEAAPGSEDGLRTEALPGEEKEMRTKASELSFRVQQYASSVSHFIETKVVRDVSVNCLSSDVDVEVKNEVTKTTDIEKEDCCHDSEETKSKKEVVEHINSEKTEAMETISISSDSRDQYSNSDTTSSSESSGSEVIQKHSRRIIDEEMEIEHSINSEKKKDLKMNSKSSQEKNHKNRRIFPSVPVSDVLIISDTSSSDDVTNMSKESEINREKVKKSTATKEKSEKDGGKSKSVDRGECDWETLYDDTGECLVPSLMEELTSSVGRVRVTSVDSDYRPYQSMEERMNDGECVIEIYDFPAEFKTTDLFNIFAAYRSRNFQIKWVDDTHALGVFPSPLMADEVLSCTLPFVKTRPLRHAIPESRNKARNLLLPPLPSVERPKTCTALARRLVSGALGLRLPTSSQEREKERQVLKEAREKRRLEAKQRDAAWDGTMTSENCI